MRFHRRGDRRLGDDPDSGHDRPAVEPSDTDHTATNGTNGAQPAGMRTRPVPLGVPVADLVPVRGGADEVDEPVDLVAVQADDELINALAAGMSVTSSGGLPADRGEEQVSAILAAWKAEVEATPIPELITVDEGVAAVRAARRPSHRLRHLAPVAAAAAFLVVVLGGVSVSSYSAQPEDALWPVAKVLYSERTQSVEAANRVEDHITRAKQAIAAGQPAVAERELTAASAELKVVRPQEGRTELAEVQDFLVAKAGETTPGVPADPGAPLTADLARKVPLGAAIAVPGRTSQPTTADQQSSSSSSGSTSPTSQQSSPPVLPVPADPRIARVPEPAPAESDESGSPAPDVTSPEQDPGESAPPVESEDPSTPGPSEPTPAAESPVPDGPVPSTGPAGSDKLGATAADTSTAEATATS